MDGSRAQIPQILPFAPPYGSARIVLEARISAGEVVVDVQAELLDQMAAEADTAHGIPAHAVLV